MRDDFATRLGEAIAWCAPRVNVDRAGETTRSPALIPPLFSKAPDEQLRLLLASPRTAAEAVEHIVRRRREALAREGTPAAPRGSLAGGRVFVTDLNTDLCGAATAPSRGFVDDHDLPGWDTWFTHEDTGSFGGWVFGWVPPSLVPFADAAFRVLPVRNLEWLDDRALRERLARR